MNLEKAVYYLLKNNPFYANFLLQSEVIYDHPKVPTAGAMMTRKGPVLAFNRNFMSSLTDLEVVALVEHEILHLLFQHTGKQPDGVIPKLANIAMDATINQYIDNLPEQCVTLKSFREFCNDPSIQEERTWEYYYSKIIKSPNVQWVEFDVHDLEGMDGVDGIKPISESEAKAALKNAVDQSMKASKGKVPEHVLKIFSDLNAPSKLNWKQLLANFVARNTSTLIKNTRKRVNRRYGIEQPGRVKKRELVLGVCADSSGSISDENWQEFLNEIKRISSLCKKVYFIDADCEVQNVQVITKSSELKFDRTGGGGTAYQPAIDECLKYNCDAIIYFGDFDTADTPKDPKKPFLWVGVGEQNPPGNFGSCVRL